MLSEGTGERDGELLASLEEASGIQEEGTFVALSGTLCSTFFTDDEEARMLVVEAPSFIFFEGTRPTKAAALPGEETASWVV